MITWRMYLVSFFCAKHVSSFFPYNFAIVRFSPTSVIDGGGAQLIRRGQPSPIRLVFWVELGPMSWYVVGSGGPGPKGRRLVV